MARAIVRRKAPYDSSSTWRGGWWGMIEGLIYSYYTRYAYEVDGERRIYTIVNTEGDP